MAPPRIWLLASPHAGDNSQLVALAEALGWPYEIKRLAYRQSERLLRFLGRASLAGVDTGRSDAIVPPFPDLIIAAGRAAEAVTAWIRRYGNRATRVVFIGTPWSALDAFDLVIATPQYGLTNHTRLLANALPLHGVRPETLAAAADKWLPRLRRFAEPRIAVLAGGSSGPYVFDAASADRLGREASRLANSCGGSLLVSTSARTGQGATRALARAISAPAYFHDWTPSGGSGDNPYLAFLATADRIIVTADSVSMIAEACATGKPVLLFDIETGRQAMRNEETHCRLPPPHWRGRTAGSTAFRLTMRYGPPRWSRDLRIIHRNVVAASLASWLGEAPPAPVHVPRTSDLDRAVARVRALFAL